MEHEHADARSAISWVVTRETPLGGQYVIVELGPNDNLNPHYVPGTCSLLSCPWPTLTDELIFDPTASRSIVDHYDGRSIPIEGAFCLDADASGACDPGEFEFSGLGGPGPEPRQPKLHHSVVLTELLDANAQTLFPEGAWPAWLAGLTETEDYWLTREASNIIVSLHDQVPDLPIILLGSVVDHIQGQPDHPHVIVPRNTLIDLGHGFVRLNPDAAYVAALIGLQADKFPELPAGTSAPWPDTERYLMPERMGGRPLDPWLVAAAALELCDRAHTGNDDPDLPETLLPVEAQIAPGP